MSLVFERPVFFFQYTNELIIKRMESRENKKLFFFWKVIFNWLSYVIFRTTWHEICIEKVFFIFNWIFIHRISFRLTWCRKNCFIFELISNTIRGLHLFQWKKVEYLLDWLINPQSYSKFFIVTSIRCNCLFNERNASLLVNKVVPSNFELISWRIRLIWLISCSILFNRYEHCCSYSSRIWANRCWNLCSINWRICSPCWWHRSWICCNIKCKYNSIQKKTSTTWSNFVVSVWKLAECDELVRSMNVWNRWEI